MSEFVFKCTKDVVINDRHGGSVHFTYNDVAQVIAELTPHIVYVEKNPNRSRNKQMIVDIFLLAMVSLAIYGFISSFK